LLVALSVLVMLVVSIVGYLSAARVARPLRRLREALDDASESSFALRISHNRRDEFGETFDAFNRAASEAEALINADVGIKTSVLATRIAA
jgi:serine/threonine-protein kinase